MMLRNPSACCPVCPLLELMLGPVIMSKGPSPLPPSLRLSVTAAHEAADLEKAAAAVRSAAQRVLGLKPSPSRRLDLQPQTSATL